MNVLSLPDEMLASVLKYNSFEDLTAVRKVSSKIDSVARRYGMDKMKIDRIRISCNNDEVQIWIEILMHGKEYRFTQPLPADLLDILKYYFSKIRGVKHLHLENFIMTKIPISNEVGEFLLGNGCKNITMLTIHRGDISINFNTMRRIMTKLKATKLFIYGSFTEFEFSDAVIEGIPFDCLVLMNRPETLKPMKLTISLPYLARLCSLKIPSMLDCTINNSTVSDLITLFKGWTKDMIHTIYWWELRISKGMMSVEETKQSLAKLKCFEEYEITHSNNWDIGKYHIAHKLSSTFANPRKTKFIITVFP